MSEKTIRTSISVIIPFFKGEKYLAGILGNLSLAARKTDNTIEVIFVNDNPADILSITKEFKGLDIKVYNSDINRGIHGARVYGLSFAQGEYILFLDQDDKLNPDFFVKQLRILGNGDAVVCNVIHRGRKKYGKRYDIKNVNDLDFALKIGNPIISPGQVIIKKSEIPTLWKERILTQNGADDWFLWILFLNEGHRFELNEEVLFEHVIDGNNTSSNEKMMSRSEKEVLQICIESHAFSKEMEDALRLGTERQDELRFDSLQREKMLTCLYSTWIDNNIKCCGPIDCLQRKGVREFAIYGAGEAGITLKNEAEAAGLSVKFFIDRMSDHIVDVENVCDPEEEIPPIGTIIVALSRRNVLVEEFLKVKTKATIISLQEILRLNS